jgi:hypothetical protein
MRYHSGRHFDVVVLQHDAARAELVRPQERARVDPPFVGNADVDVATVQRKELLRHRRQRRWPPGIHRRGEPGRPGGVEQVAVFQIVIGVVVRDEDVPQRL